MSSEDDSISLFSVASRGVAPTSDAAVAQARLELERTVSVGNASKAYHLRRLSEVADSVEAQYERELANQQATSTETVAAITALALASHNYLSSGSSDHDVFDRFVSSGGELSSCSSAGNTPRPRPDGMFDGPGPYSPKPRSDGC